MGCNALCLQVLCAMHAGEFEVPQLAQIRALVFEDTS